MKDTSFRKSLARFLASFCTDLAVAQFLLIPLESDPALLTVRIFLCIVYAGCAIWMDMLNQ